MTRDEAISLAKTEWWKGLSDRDVVGFQLFEDKLCMDFGTFHEIIERVMGRPIFTHEFAYANDPNGLKAEFLGIAPKRSLEDIINLIPEEKRVVVLTPTPDGNK